MNKLRRFKDDQNGQAMALVALLFVVLLGFGALVVDTGLMADTRSKLQATADAAALAGASKLPDSTKVESNVKHFVDLNSGTGTTHTTEINAALKTVKVTVKKDVDHLFAKVLNFNSSTIGATATAEQKIIWDGYALPFINLDQRYWESKYWGPTAELIQLWNKQDDTSGSFELVHSSEIDVTKGYLKTGWADGIKVREGNVSNYVDYVNTMLANGGPYFAIGLDQERVETRVIDIEDKHGNLKTIDLKIKSEKLNGEDNILPHQLVLLQITNVTVTGSGANMVVTGKLEHVYNIGKDEIPENVTKYGLIKTWLIK
ncbi:MAG: pilus assembly protein TadG-related protein [Clostridiaceae bacterium]